MTREIRTYGLSEDALRERLADLLADTTVAVTLSFRDGHGSVTVTADPEVLEDVVNELAVRIGGFVYSYEGESLATAVVRLLTAHKLTVATAESCTGGLIAAALTDVPGASRVFGTGVVSYSNQCKERLLTVSSDTIATLGAVSAETAGQMARGVRQTADSHLGVSVTGEAGPLPAEDLPVGTVFIALADQKRTWVEEWHLDGPDRDAIRRQAADRVLWLTWRYLAAYPAVMAGGESNRAAQQRTIPRGVGAKRPSIFSIFLPWRGDSRRRFWLKMLAWLVVVAMLLTGLQYGYQHLIQPYRHRQLQSSLGEMYHHQPTDLTDGAESPEDYPAGLLPEFRGLYRRNQDIGGWIQIQDTQIDSPVMNYAEGYYGNHSFDKEYSIYGQLHFGPAGAKGVYAVYGKNTGDGQMFSDLMHYRRVAYLQEHPLIKCNTVYQTGTWQIYAVLVADENNPEEFRYVPQSWEEEGAFEQYIQQVRQRALVIGDQPVSQEDEFLILSTNAQQVYGFSGARLVVLAHRVAEAAEVTYRTQTYARMPSAYYKGYPTTTLSTTGSTTQPTQTTPSASAQPTDPTNTPTHTPTDPDLDDVAPTDTAEDTVTTTETTLPTEGTTIPTQEGGTEQ